MADAPSNFDALVAAAEAVLGEPLTPEDRERLGDLFVEAKGTTGQRSAKALREFTGSTTVELEKFADEWEGTSDLSRMTLKWTVRGQ